MREGLLLGLLPLREAEEFVKGEGLLSGEFPLHEAAYDETSSNCTRCVESRAIHLATEVIGSTGLLPLLMDDPLLFIIPLAPYRQ